MKKVIFVNSSLTDGGSERVMTLLANHIANNGYDVTMILVRNKIRTYKLDKKINCIQLEYKYNSKIYILFSRIFKLRKIFKNINADTIISFMVDINCFTILANIGLKNKIIISERANPYVRKKVFTKLGEKILYPLVDIIVFQTEMVRNYYNKKINKKGVVIPNPINIDLNNCKTRNREKTVIAVGRFTSQKNFKMLIDAFNKFSEKYYDYRLFIYGDGPLKNELSIYANNLESREKIFFPGYKSNINEIMCNSGMYVSSSDFEGISNSMLEAMALGLPTICTDCPVGGARMVIKDGINGVLVPVGNADKLYNAMIKIASEVEFAENISREAIKVKDTFSYTIIGRIWMDII